MLFRSLDANKTSPYKFYQFWLNTSDEDAKKYIRIFTLLSKEEIEVIEKEHAKEPHLRALQQSIAKDITIRVHSEDDYMRAVEASQILFGKGTAESLKELSENDLLAVFEGVPQVELIRSELEKGIDIVDFLVDKTNIFPSKGEARKMIQGGGISINKTKVENAEAKVGSDSLLNEKYILAQKGKKNYWLIRVG